MFIIGLLYKAKREGVKINQNAAFQLLLQNVHIMQ